MRDELVIQIRGMPDYRLPVEVISEGNPVTLPDQQVRGSALVIRGLRKFIVAL